MAQNDLEIANQSFPATRADINSALQALGSTNSGSSAPPTLYANMQWYDTSSNKLYQRNEANDAWILMAFIDPLENKFKIPDDTKVFNPATNNDVGTLGVHTEATWKSGTSASDRLIAPDKLKAVLDDFGVDLGSDLIDINGFNNDNYMEIGSGSTKLLVQWLRGTVTVAESEGQLSVNWPKSFTNVFNVQISLEIDVGATMDAGLYVREYSNTSCKFSVSAPNLVDYGDGKYHIIGIGI